MDQIARRISRHQTVHRVVTSDHHCPAMSVFVHAEVVHGPARKGPLFRPLGKNAHHAGMALVLQDTVINVFNLSTRTFNQLHEALPVMHKVTGDVALLIIRL